MVERERCLARSAEVEVTHQLGVDGDLSPDQGVTRGKATHAQSVSVGLNAHLVIVAELLVQRGGQWGGAGARLKIRSVYLLHFITRSTKK